MAENGDNEKMAALEAKICHQIGYYLGDLRLPRDNFLKEKIKLDEGWVPLEITIKFNRLNRLTDFNVIVEALSKSKAEVMEISEDKTKIRRSPKWLEDKGQVLNIQMRRTLHKAFKGSIFVVFGSIESDKKFVETPGQKYKDTDLLILFKDDCFAKKKKERKQNKVEAKLRAKQEQEIGCLLKFLGDLDDQTYKEDLRILFSNHGEIKWIDFIRGAKEGIILFKEKAKETLGKAKDANNGNLQLRNKEVTWEVLEGEMEKEALKKIIEDQQESLNKWKSKSCRFKGKKRVIKMPSLGLVKEKYNFRARKQSLLMMMLHDENGSTGPMKKRKRRNRQRRTCIQTTRKTENGAGDQ
uniref:Uncharacterized protein n=1 Tax=Nomascus leucogenys TaxID=61853 RepID=A0A2I3GWU6_NOMLE